MNRDIFILLILREFLSDSNLCKIISNFIIDKEYKLNLVNHQKSAKHYMNDITLFYPGFLKMAIFERFRFDELLNHDPGYIIYDINPVRKYGYYINWDLIPPIKYKQYEDPIDTRGIIIINRLHKKDKQIIQKIYNKIKPYRDPGNHISVWYDFESDMFFNI